MSVTLNSNALVTLADVREALFLETLEIKDDDFLTNLINRYSTRIESYCKRVFNAGLFTEFHDGDGERGELLIDNPPIISVSGLWDDPGGYGKNDSINYGSDTVITSGEYVTESEEGTIRLVAPGTSLFNLNNCFQKGVQNIKIIYSGGYVGIPNDVQDACIECIAGTYRKYKERLMGVASKGSAGGSITPDSKAMSDNVKATLAAYRRFIF